MERNRNARAWPVRCCRCLVLIAAIGYGPELTAQEIPVAGQPAEAYAGETTAESDFLEILLDLERDPVPLNKATTADLLAIPFLDPANARAIIRYRNLHGGFSRIGELAQVPLFHPELLTAIAPYVTLNPVRRRNVLEYRLRSAYTLDRRAGYSGGQYNSPAAVYQRIRCRAGEMWSAGLLLEKDAGESRWNDLLSAFVTVSWLKQSLRVHGGDFELVSGQHLVLGGPYGIPVSLETRALLSRRLFRWKPKSSTEETVFYRGMLVDYRISDHLQAVAAISFRRLDGRADSSGLAIQSLATTGYHRTKTETEGRGLLRERLAAGWLRGRVGSFSGGILFTGGDYSRPLFDPASGIYRRRMWHIAAVYDIRKPAWRMQGEVALAHGKWPAVQQSFLVRPRKSPFRYGGGFYYYHHRFSAIRSRAFGTTSGLAGNRLGYLLSMELIPAAGWSAGMLFWLERTGQPEDRFQPAGRRWQLQILRRTRRSEIDLRFSRRTISEPLPLIRAADKLSPVHQLRMQIKYRLNSRFYVRHRLTGSWGRAFSLARGSFGLALFQDLNFRVRRGLRIQARWTIFDIPEYDLRIYEFENDLPGSFTNLVLHNRGYKWYLLLSWRPATGWEVAVKFRELLYPDESALGSGADRISGNRKRDVRLQWQVSL